MKILVVKLSSMGDVLHALPTAAELKRQTGADMHWAVHPAFAQLVRCFSCVDRVLEIPRHGGLGAFRKALGPLRETDYDLVVDLQGLFKSALVARLARLAPGGRRVGPSFQREGASLFYSATPKLILPRRHAVEECLDVLPLLGLERPAEPLFPMDPPEVDVGPSGVFRVAIAPMSRWETKTGRWRISRPPRGCSTNAATRNSTSWAAPETSPSPRRSCARPAFPCETTAANSTSRIPAAFSGAWTAS